jgi:hypothetical protein
VGRYNILSKVDRALTAFVISEGAGTTQDTFPGKLASDRVKPPFTVCYSESGREKIENSGEYLVKACIHVYTNCAPARPSETADQIKLDSDDRVASVFDCFHIEAADQSGASLADLITAAARASAYSDLLDFTVLDVTLGDMEQGDTGKTGNKGMSEQWIDSLNLTLLCVPANVSD